MYEGYFNNFITVIPLRLYAFCDIDFDPDFIGLRPHTQKMMTYLLPDIYKQTRDVRPFNLLKFGVISFFGFIFAFVIFYVDYFSFKNMITDINGNNSLLKLLLWF